MKNLLLSSAVAAALSVGAYQANAQTPYTTSLGLGIDMGNGTTFVGPQVKHSFGGHNAGNAQVLFGNGATILGADYSYNQLIPGANGLAWYVGFGPQLGFRDSRTYFAIRPAAGLDFKIPTAPIGFHFDWKPWWNLTNNTDFEPGRFSLGLKFILR